MAGEKLTEKQESKIHDMEIHLLNEIHKSQETTTTAMNKAFEGFKTDMKEILSLTLDPFKDRMATFAEYHKQHFEDIKELKDELSSSKIETSKEITGTFNRIDRDVEALKLKVEHILTVDETTEKVIDKTDNKKNDNRGFIIGIIGTVCVISTVIFEVITNI